MKKIGGGVQYDVFDLGNGRVRKVKTSSFQKITRLHRIASKYKIYRHPFRNIRTALGIDKTTISALTGLKERVSKIDPALIGNPRIINDTDYEQDKVSPLGEKLLSSQFAESKTLVNEYIENIQSGWDYGFCDTVFNFMINAGVTQQGKVILIDLGELTYDESEVTELVITKHWKKHSSFNKLENIELKNYIRDRFDQEITLSNLDNRWGSKLN